MVKNKDLTERAIRSLNYIIVMLDEEGQEQYAKWYNIAYSVLYTKISEGADFKVLEEYCNSYSFLETVFRSVNKFYSIKQATPEKSTTISQQIASDISLTRYLLEKLQKEVNYYEMLLTSKKTS